MRGPVDAAFPALPGPIQYIFEGKQNLGKLEASGVDMNVAYRGPATSIGRFAFKFNGTYIDQWKQQLNEQLNNVDFISLVGRSVVGAVPRWKHFALLSWTYGPWSAALTQTFTSGYSESNASATNKERRVGSYEIWNAWGTYSGFKNTTITLGVKNLFDRAPPFSYQSDQGQVMYDPRYADPRGRVFYAQVALAFK